jgi:hypothetical protein
VAFHRWQDRPFLAALDTSISATACSLLHRPLAQNAGRPCRSAFEQPRRYKPYLESNEDDKFNPMAAPLWDDHLLGALICPRPLLIESGAEDPYVDPEGAIREARKLADFYSLLGCEERLQTVIAQGVGHEMLVDSAVPFFERWL